MKILIFGGASEGHRLSRALCDAGMDVTLSVATHYGKEAALGCRAAIRAERLGGEEMLSLLKQGGFDRVIDATHPYAVLATENIRSACLAAGVKYMRLKRPESSSLPGVSYVPDARAAVGLLNKSGEKALLAMGSKELAAFIHVQNYAERLFVRILPMPDSLKYTLDLGFRGANIICMQGPFSKEMNVATLKMTGAKVLVTKDGGEAGGFEEKVAAAHLLGCGVIALSRPSEEEGLTLGELLEYFGISEVPDSRTNQTAFFPLFTDINGKKALVTGGGKVAERRVRILAAFGAKVTVISPSVTGYIEREALNGNISLIRRRYQNGDITALKPFLAVAATDEREANRLAAEEAKSLNIPVSAADCRDECTFFFPAVMESKDYIAGLISKNGNHTGVSHMAEKIRRHLNP